MANNGRDRPIYKKAQDSIAKIGYVITAPLMACFLCYSCFIADRDPWGGQNHPERDHSRAEKGKRKEQEQRERDEAGTKNQGART